MSRFHQVTGYFGPRSDPYAGGDLANAQRLSAMLWGVGLVLGCALLPTAPPVDPSTAAGWAIFAVLAVVAIVLIELCRRRRINSWGGLLAVGYAVVTCIGVLQWITGGLGGPYERLLLLAVIFVAATQPPRQIAVFMLFVFVVLMSPLVYDGWDGDEAAGLITSFLIWSGLAFAGNLLMGGVREQRIALAADQAEARQEARIDSLTELHNRRAFDEILESEVRRARRLGLPLTVAMIDIENFKEVNDRWSYAEGDRCLRDVAKALQDSLRQPDFCFRWGGDEFALVLSGTSAEATQPVAERLRKEITSRCRRPDDTPIQVRFAAAELDGEMDPEELTERAGLALTAVKMDAR